jgi:hypothetical protein
VVGTDFARSLEQLHEAISVAARRYSENWPEKKAKARLHQATPATNLVTISTLIGNAEIEGVFDPYLDNRALAALIDILSLSGSVSKSVRLLSSGHAVPGKGKSKLTKTFVAQWFAEHNVASGEVRVMAPGQHRRFILLSGRQSLLLGMSLNSMAKNEAVRLESDYDDRPLFNLEWVKASPLS